MSRATIAIEARDEQRRGDDFDAQQIS